MEKKTITITFDGYVQEIRTGYADTSHVELTIDTTQMVMEKALKLAEEINHVAFSRVKITIERIGVVERV